ncbi:MAG: hypothetical protein IT370_23235 [Deltaproteobacteria bacterium]|nr:hypothetical protein [Deltaproteobacteria bacterium]
MGLSRIGLPLAVVAGLALASTGARSARAEAQRTADAPREGKARTVTLACGDDLAATMKVPAGWTDDPVLAARASSAVEAVGAAGDAVVHGLAQAFAAPGGDAVLVLTWATTPGTAPETATAQARAFVSDYKLRVKRGMVGLKVVLASSNEQVRGNRADARVEWSIKKHKLRGLTRAHAVALASTGFHGLSLQCVYNEKSAQQRRPACEAALASLTLSTPSVMLALEGKGSGAVATARTPVLAPPRPREAAPAVVIEDAPGAEVEPGATGDGPAGPASN